jgi:hypothetical protein
MKAYIVSSLQMQSGAAPPPEYLIKKYDKIWGNNPYNPYESKAYQHESKVYQRPEADEQNS